MVHALRDDLDLNVNSINQSKTERVTVIQYVSLMYISFSMIVFQVLESWSPKLSHENDGLIFNPAEEVSKLLLIFTF